MCLILPACSSVFNRTPDNVNYYVLTPIPAEQRMPPTGRRDPVVAVAGVRLPDYLSQKGIVTRSTSNQISIAFDDQWGGHLDDNIATVLVENLSAQIPSSKVFGFPIAAATPMEYTVRVEIGSFEREANGSVRLIARWAITKATGEIQVTMSRATYETANVPMNYNAISAAMSQVLGELSLDIASAIRTIPRAGS
jgi:uncharacterized lipoprotein YmbA